MRPQLLADPVDEHLDASAARADVHVEALLVDEQLAELTERAPPGSFVKVLGADVLEGQLAARADDWVVHRAIVAFMSSREPTNRRPVIQMRLVVEADDYDDALRFYRDALGLPEEAAFEGDGDARVVILQAGRATLEIANPAQKRMIDEVEVGRQVAPKLRVAFEVADCAGVTDQLVVAGATLVAEPTETPWRSLNARLDAPAGLHITLFQELETDGGVPPR